MTKRERPGITETINRGARTCTVDCTPPQYPTATIGVGAWHVEAEVMLREASRPGGPS